MVRLAERRSTQSRLYTSPLSSSSAELPGVNFSPVYSSVMREKSESVMRGGPSFFPMATTAFTGVPLVIDCTPISAMAVTRSTPTTTLTRFTRSSFRIWRFDITYFMP